MRRPHRRAPLLVLPALVLVVILGVGCSDDDGDETSPTTTSPTTTEPARAQLDSLVAAYRAAVAAATTAGALDEQALAGLHRAFTGSRAEQELDGLQEAGVEVLAPSGLVTVPVEVVQPYWFRLVPAAEGAAAPAWRLDFFNFSNDDVSLEAGAACP